MSEAAPAYTIVGGKADADRLAREAEVMDANSRAFLERVGLGPGWRCLDVGCGTGPVTIDMARMAGPGGDPLIGPRLGTLLRDAGCQDVEQKVVVNPMKTIEEKLFLAELVPNMREAILAAGAATADEVDELHDAVAAAARDEDRTFFQTEIYQVSGRRPG